MRILVDLKSHVAGRPVVTQVEQVPEDTQQTPINGKYLLPIALGDFQLTSTDHVLPVDGTDLSSKSFGFLLASFPMYGSVWFSPLLTSADVDEIDFATPFVDPIDGPLPPRFQTGLPSLFTPSSMMPMMTAIPPINNYSTPPHPGMLITTEIDISAQTLGVGADDFMVYWKLYDFSTQQDILDETINVPAVKLVSEAEPEPADFLVYFSPDNGAHWVAVNFMTAVAFGTKTTKFRLAFRNNGATKRFLANFAVLF